MSITTRELWEYLRVAEDETAVLSAVFEPDEAGLRLRCASLLIGPSGIGEGGWPAWRLVEGHEPAPNVQEVDAPAEFHVEMEQGSAGRVTMTPSNALAWLRSCVERGECPAVGVLPAARARLSTTKAPIRVTSHSETVAGDLAVWLARPVAGFHFHRADTPADIAPPDRVKIGVDTFFNPMVGLLGIGWFDSQTTSPPSGLLVGRFERRAWLIGQHLRPDDDLYEVHIGLEPDRVDLADLELDVEERVGEETVISERLRLEDVELRDVEDALDARAPAPTGRSVVRLLLPTLGRGIKRTVRLHHRDGSMLDEWPPFNIVESIGLTMEVNGARQPTVWIGDRREAPDLVELLGAVQRVRSQYATMRRGGLAARLFDDPADGREALRKLLLRAPGELFVIDPWLRDWDLVDNLPSGPCRVLLGSSVDPPPPTFAGKVAQHTGDLAPFHDRFFLWEGGGVTVGTSAGTSKRRLFRIARISGVEADELRQRFALWWSDAGFQRIH